MGLDIVELLMRIEDDFGIEIPDRDAERLTTPREVADYVCSRVDLVSPTHCITAREFYRLRTSIHELGVVRSGIRPRSRFVDLSPESERAHSWAELGKRVAARQWPSLERPWQRPSQSSYPRGCETVWGLARHLATWNDAVPTGTGARWCAETVLLRVRQITSEELGIKTFNDDDHYVLDLGAD